MKRVYLIRHALPDFPGGQRMCLGRTDIPLGSEGLEQARIMAGNLPPVTAVYSSPLRRAVQTARAIAEPVILEDLREMDAGEWDGLTFAQIRQRYPELYAARGKDLTLPLPGGEDREAGLRRFCGAMAYAAAESPGDLAVVAHGGIIAGFLQDITGRWQKPDYAQVVELWWENGAFFGKEGPKSTKFPKVTE